VHDARLSGGVTGSDFHDQHCFDVSKCHCALARVIFPGFFRPMPADYLFPSFLCLT
jgi:hypothetical protein